ncbi:PIF1 [Mytilus coruscus]|uniref:PIF1 n=1 Tax=Mytilus coruscus TaxID=42192 RepID=A0A6J8A306_MYTCO|nr:PIF1 [Mytilus coruscus]
MSKAQQNVYVNNIFDAGKTKQDNTLEYEECLASVDKSIYDELSSTQEKGTPSDDSVIMNSMPSVQSKQSDNSINQKKLALLRPILLVCFCILITAWNYNHIDTIERGILSDETVVYINSLSSPLENEEDCVHLFSRNFHVDLFNYSKIQNAVGELKVYKSADEGSTYYLDKFLAPKHFGLKVGCPVMLLKNLTNKLVNGLRGTVVQMNSASVDVKFEIEERTFTTNIKKYTFTTFDPVDKKSFS